MDPEDVAVSLINLKLLFAQWLAPWRSQVDHALDGLGRALGAVEVFDGPSLDYSQTAAQADYLFDVPGYAAEDLALSVSDQALTLTGHRPDRADASITIQRIVERRRRPFVRSVPLPSGADLEAIGATLKAGVLHVVVPRRPHGSALAVPIRIVPAAGRA